MPTWLLGLKGVGIAALAGALLSAGATFYVTSLGYRLTISSMEKAKAEDAAHAYKGQLDQFTADAGKIKEAASRFEAVKTNLDARFATINRNLTDAIKANPLPASCPVLDDGRMRSLQAAIAAANSATGRKPVAVVPAHP
jgi:hypothetical protein